MPDSLSTFAVRDTLVRIDRSGCVTAVEHRGRPGWNYLSLGLPEDPAVAWTPTGITIDADEAEIVLEDPSGLAVTVRHTFVAGWRLRCLLVNSDSRPRRLRPRIPLSPGADIAASAVAEGAEAELFLSPAHGRGPLLIGRLLQGSVEKITARGLELPALVLDPGERYVLAWEWVWLARPAAYVRRWPAIHPGVTTCIRQESVLVPAGPDVALVAPPGLGIETVDDGSSGASGYELTADAPGSARIELRSARGLRTIELTWTPTPEEVLGRAAADLLASSRRSAGVAVLPGLEAALVVQHAHTAELLDDTDDAGDALDRYTARLEYDLLDPVFGGLFLCGEHGRTGEPALLEAASSCLARAGGPMPGLGLVGTRICVARLLAGLSPQPVMDRLLALTGELDECVEALNAPVAGDRIALAAAAELLAVTRSSASTGPGGPTPDRDVLLRLVLAMGTELGAGLPGGSVVPLPVDRLGHLLATLAVLPDDLAAPTRRFWGVAARDLSEQAMPTLLARLGGLPAGQGHVWLGLLIGAR